MTTLKNIISGNLDMLKNQEAEIQKSLEFVQKAISLFSSQKGNAIQRKRGILTAKTISQDILQPAKGKRKGTYFSMVMETLQQKNGQVSGDIIQALFAGQTKEKNKQRFAQNIYNVIHKAKTKGILQSKNSKIYLS